MTVPQEAITAAADAITRELMSGKDYSMTIDSDEALAEAALNAAAPHIAAAERDRIRQFARDEATSMRGDDSFVSNSIGAGALEDFADLIGES